MTITAKVRCNSRTASADGQTASLVFGADYYTDEAKEINAAWAYYTPGLNLQMTVRSEVPFEPGMSYTLTFEPEPQPEPAGAQQPDSGDHTTTAD